MTEATATPSLREQFEDACVYHRKMWAEHNSALEKGHTGTEQDFYKHFDEVANGLKAKLKKLIGEIDQYKSPITSLGCEYMGEPLQYEFVFPASMSPAQQRSIEVTGLYSISGYQKIHEICSSKEVDMDVRVALIGSSYRTANGESVGYDGIRIEIDPTRPYTAKPDSRSRPGPTNSL